MRSFFIAITLVVICGCRTSYPYMNLRRPIYMMTDKSLWVGCKKDPTGETACRKFRVSQIQDGVDEWFRHFDEPTRPQVIIVSSKSELPRDLFNAVIYLRIQLGGCSAYYDGDGVMPGACYQVKRDSTPEIIFEEPDDVCASLVEHEFGHVLGLKHMDPKKEIFSIMLPVVLPESYVMPVDVDAVCKLHAECPPHEDTGGECWLYDEDRCPSYSFE